MYYSLKNTVPQPVNKFQAFSVNPKVHYRAHKSTSLFTFLGAMNPVPLILVLPILLNILLSSRLRFSKLSLLLMSLQQIPAAPLLLPIRATNSAHLFLLDLLTKMTFG